MKTVLLILMLVTATYSSAQTVREWSDCQDDLDRVRKAARDANEQASEADSKAKDLNNCRTYPRTYDLYKDGCLWYRSNYESAVRDLASELDTLSRRLRSVESSCNFEFGLSANSVAAPIAPVVPTPTDKCAVFRSYKGKLADADILSVCSQYLGREACQKCLSAR